MEHLQEICGDNTEKNKETCGKIKLDEQVISNEDLEKKRQDGSIRIAEVSEGNYKTLHHLRG